MDYETAKFLIDKADRLSDMADNIFMITENANAASIVRQAGWYIKDSIPMKYRTTYQLNKLKGDHSEYGK